MSAIQQAIMSYGASAPPPEPSVCVWNSAKKSAAIMLSESNSKASATNEGFVLATVGMPPSTGKYYWEIALNLATNLPGAVAVANSSVVMTSNMFFTATIYGVNNGRGKWQTPTEGSIGPSAPSFGLTSRIGMEYDSNARSFRAYQDDVLIFEYADVMDSATYYPAVGVPITFDVGTSEFKAYFSYIDWLYPRNFPFQQLG